MSIKSNIPEAVTFLVLEDMENIRKEMVKDLKSLGFTGTIFEAENVKRAEGYLSQKKIDYVVSDWNLPDGTGLDLLKKCRAVAALKNIPFLMVTSMDSISDMLDAIEAGVSDYLVKPWDKEELAKKLAYAYETAYGGGSKE